MKRIVVFRNGRNVDGKILLVPSNSSMSDVLQLVSAKLKGEIRRLFTHNGGEIEDPAVIRDEDTLFASTGEEFCPPPVSIPFLQPSCSYVPRVFPPPLSSLDPKSDWISLNVGGTIFTTTRTTILNCQDKDCLLTRMFQEDSTMVPSQRDASGSYLIDRSPKYFEPILNYIRTGNLVLDDTVGPEGVLQEAIFFGVDSVIPQLEALVERRRLASVPDPPLTRPQVISALIRTASNAELRFQGVNLTGADLSKLDLRFINLKYSCLRDANFQGTSLNHANLERVDLRGANLEGAHLLGVRLMCANLEGATLKGCYFEDPLGTKACLEGANLKNAVLENSAMAGVNLRVANLKNANLRNCDLRSAVLAGADLENCDLTGSDLHEANLRGANLNGAALELMVNPIHMAQTTGATTGAVIRYAPTNSAHTM